MRSNWAYDQPESLNDHARFYTEVLLVQNGCTLEPISLSRQAIDGSPELENGGREQRSILSTIVKSTLGFEGIHDCLFRQPEPWLIDDFTMSEIWYITVLAHTDRAFRKVFQDYLHCYRSPSNRLETVTSDHILKTTFDIATVVDQVKNASPNERNDFLNTLALKGSLPMVAPFFNANIDPDGSGIRKNPLRNASACGKLDVIDMVTDGGANCIQAYPRFCETTNLDVSKYPKLLESMAVPRGMTPHRFAWTDPVNAMLKMDHAMESHGDVLMKLLEHGLFWPRLIHGSPNVYHCNSYVHNAIMYNRPAGLAWFLDHGAKPNDIIQDIFDTNRSNLHCLKRYSWLTMAVQLGRKACVKVLLESAEDMHDAVTSRDGAGRSAINLAQSFPDTLHPRVPSLQDSHIRKIRAVSAAEDASTLTLLEAALGITSESAPTIDLDMADKVRQQHTRSMCPFFGRPRAYSTNLPSVLTHLATLLTAIFHYIDYIFHFISTGTRTRLFHRIKDQFNQLWRMSSFEALLVRLSFLVAYCMLFCYKMITFTTTLTKLFERSDFRLFLKVCVVALIFYSLEF